MKYFPIPENVVIDALYNPETKKEFVYSFSAYNVEYVWVDPEWRKSGDTAEHFESCHAKIHGKKPGHVVELTDPEWETYCPIATMRGKQVAAHLAPDLMKFQRPVLQASSKKPEGDAKVGPAPADGRRGKRRAGA